MVPRTVADLVLCWLETLLSG
jgi:hypothetical protein